MTAFLLHTLRSTFFSPVTLKRGVGSPALGPVGFGMGPFKHGRNCAHATSCDCGNLPLLPPRAAYRVYHLPVKYRVALQSQLIWQGFVGRQRCPEGQSISGCLSSPASPIQANVTSDPNGSGASSCSSDRSFTQCPGAQTPGKPTEGKLGCTSKRGSHPQCS